MYQTKLVKIRDNLYALEQAMTIEEGVVRCFLLIGSEKALLIDCGVTPDDLPGLVRTVTDLPLLVALTHADGDHTVNVNRFPCIQMHEDDMHLVLRRYQDAEIEIQNLNDGDQIDLGGLVLDVLHIPGHTHGSLAYLNRSEHYLIPGDSVDYAPVHMYGTHRNFPDYMRSLKRLKDLGGFDCLYSSHAELCLPASAVSQQLQVCEGIQDGTIPGQAPIPEHLKKTGAKLYRKGPCSVYYTPASK